MEEGFMLKIEDNTAMNVLEHMKEARRLALVEKAAAIEENNPSALMGCIQIVAQLDEGIRLLKEGLK